MRYSSRFLEKHQRLREDGAEGIGACKSEKKNGPDAPGTNLLRDEYKRAMQRARNIIEIRLKKITDIARLDASGGKTDTKNILPEEIAVKDKLISVLQDWMKSALMEECVDSEKTPPEKERVPVQDAVKSDPAPKLTDKMVVAVIADIPPFAGKDRNYALKKGDVVTIPANIGQVLCRSNKVRRIL